MKQPIKPAPKSIWLALLSKPYRDIKHKPELVKVCDYWNVSPDAITGGRTDYDVVRVKMCYAWVLYVSGASVKTIAAELKTKHPNVCYYIRMMKDYISSGQKEYVKFNNWVINASNQIQLWNR